MSTLPVNYKSKYRLKVRNPKRFPDKILSFCIVFLLSFGIIAIYDSTGILSQQIYKTPYKFVLLQLSWLAVGAVGFIIFYNLELSYIKRVARPLFYVTASLLALLAIFGVLPCSLNFIFTPCVNGANRWLYFNPHPLPPLPVLGVLGFQPSELAKFSAVLFFASFLSDMKTSIKDETIKFFIFLGSVSLLIVLQPNMSTAALIFAIGLSMYFASGFSIKPFLLALPPFTLLGLLAMLASPHSRARIERFTAAFSGNADANVVGYHVKQILIALGSGGIFGVGFGQSRQKFNYLPEVFADSIFAIIGEELGFVGTVSLVFVFGLLIYKGYSVALKSKDMYARLLAVGITSWIAIQFFVNISAMTQLIPLTGMPLPLISYGGSSLVFMLMGIGVLSNISRMKS